MSQNLITNGSFENYTEDLGNSHCVTNFSSMLNWQQIFSPDIFVKPCTFANHYGVPDNMFGNSNPKNGIAYVGLGLINLPNETKEYIYQHLTNPLIVGKTYFTSFFISKADKVSYSIKNIGAYFSINQPTVVSNPYIQAIPQVENHNGFLTDTVNWVKIEGYFTAQGGEQYITIGNFNSNADTDTLNSGTTNPIPFDTGTSYYYIDSVSLYDSLTYVTSVRDLNKEVSFSLYPNPNNGTFTLDYSIQKEAELIITDVAGQKIGRYVLLPFQNKLPVNKQELGTGIYFYSVRQGNLLLKHDKIVIIK